MDVTPRRYLFVPNAYQGWGLDLQSMQESLDDARRHGIVVRALVFINPGNPTGNCLTREDLETLVRFCVDNRYVLLVALHRDNDRGAVMCVVTPSCFTPLAPAAGSSRHHLRRPSMTHSRLLPLNIRTCDCL